MGLALVKEDIITKKDYVNDKSNLNPKYGVHFTDFIRLVVAKRKRLMGDSYVGNYNTLILHLENFCHRYGCVLYTNSITDEFLGDFIIYLRELNLKANYIKGIFNGLRAMIRKAGVYGYAVDPSWDDVKVESEIPFSIYLSMNEITRIYYFQGLSKKEKRIRDLFVLGCLTGMRYSDYSTISENNISGDYIVKLTKKTKTKVTIPLHDYVKEIIKRYPEGLEFGLSLQHFNRYIKEICEKVGLTERVSYSYIRGGRIVETSKPKAELISSHTARRSFCTNIYLTGRLKPYQIMAITGHTTEKSFFRYIRIDNESLARQVAGDIIFKG